MSAPFARTARREDAADIARIYNEGIEDRTATFETELRGERDVLRWFDDGPMERDRLSLQRTVEPYESSVHPSERVGITLP